MAEMITPTAHFDGKFSEFFTLYMEPNLPSAERVHAFDQLLRRHLSGDDPVHVTRYVRGRVRGTICQTAAGGRMLPTDNAPVWWLHAFLMSDAPLPESAEVWFSDLPCHFHDMARFQTLNQAGFHAAHILSAKNRDTAWQTWSHSELARRMLVNIHPCNIFLVAKPEWRRNGGRQDIIAWVVDAYRRRYGDTMNRFLADCDPDASFSRPAGDPVYSYGTASRSGGAIQTLRPIIRKNHVARGISLEITVDGTRYLLPHDDLVAWAREHTTALVTVSWIERGVYSWPRPSALMTEFLRDYRLP